MAGYALYMDICDFSHPLAPRLPWHFSSPCGFVLAHNAIACHGIF